MIPYWTIYFISTLGVVLQLNLSKNIKSFFWFFFIIILTLFIGLRHDVGGDWLTYYNYFNNYTYPNSQFNNFHPFNFSSTQDDYGYDLISYIVRKLNFGVYGIYVINLICAIIFMFSLNKFSLRQPYPWLVLVISIPYLITVVAMGYVRQSVALAFIILSIVSLIDEKKLIALIYFCLAIIFHKPVLVMTPLLMFGLKKLNFKSLLIFSIPIFAFLSVFYRELWELLIYYIDGIYNLKYPKTSAGAMLRLILNVIPAIIFLKYRNKISGSEIEKRIFTFMSIFVLTSIFFVNQYSVLIDRILIYFMPLQLYVLSRISLIIVNKSYTYFFHLIIISFYTMIYYVWMNFATFSYKWFPYEMLFFIDPTIYFFDNFEYVKYIFFENYQSLPSFP